MTDILDFSSTDNMGKYLRTPIIHGRRTYINYKQLLDKMASKLESWEAAKLSMVGRISDQSSPLNNSKLFDANIFAPELYLQENG